MSKHATLRTRPVPFGHGETHPDVRRAWIAVALFPVAVVAAMVFGDAVLSALGYPSGGEETAPLGVALGVGLPALLLAISPGVVAYLIGMRARRQGVEAGFVPAVVGGTLAAAFFLLNIAAFVVGR